MAERLDRDHGHRKEAYDLWWNILDMIALGVLGPAWTCFVASSAKTRIVSRSRGFKALLARGPRQRTIPKGRTAAGSGDSRPSRSAPRS